MIRAVRGGRGIWMKADNNNLLLNEEDLKNKILLPYLESLKFSPDEVFFETGFKLRFGTSERITTGRSDILCKSRGDMKNLFLIEVKAEHVNIHDRKHIEQGWSYARLVNPIAPFVLITNGKDTLVIDTITTKDISGSDISDASDFWRNGCTLAAKEEIELRYEALKNFIGYSPENVEIFSRSQVDSRIQTLKGGIDEKHTKKYIPELFLEKEEINEAFKHFLVDKSKCFALIGEAGVGKTNLICGLAENFIKEHVGLFYNAADLATDLVSSIKDDFNWIFSPQFDAPDIFRRLEGLTERRHSKVCIFIDAIDEAPIANFPQVLNDFVYKIR